MSANVNLIQPEDAKLVGQVVKRLINGYTIESYKSIESMQLSPTDRENEIEIRIVVKVVE